MGKYSYLYPRPGLTVDIVGLLCQNGVWRVLLIKRAKEPFKNKWALPGGFVEENEDLEVAARRELKEEVNVEPTVLRQFYCFGKPGRDPRGWCVSIGFVAVFDEKMYKTVRAGDDAKDADWFAVTKLPELAFDHNEIVARALETVKQWQKLGIIKGKNCD